MTRLKFFKIKCILFLLMMIFSTIVYSVPLTIIYPKPETSDDSRTKYPVKLLELALTKAKVEYKLVPSDEYMQQDRALFTVATSDKNFVVWSMTSKERESKLMPIRIPIYKGLIGWRIFLINKVDLYKFSKISNLSELKKLSAGQGHDWPDTEILKSNGFKVFPGPNYLSLFKMLEVKRFDYFPRSVAEIWAEAEAHKDQGIVVEPTIVLQYPAAFYYFVNKNNKVLANIIDSGLKIAIKDGSYNKLFLENNKEVIDKANLKNRKVFKLKNPLLPKETPLNQEDLWFQIK